MKKLLLLGFAAILFNSCINQNEQQAKNSGVEIFFEETTHDYGDIQIDSDGSYTFKFKNIGKKPLIVNKVRSTCGCTIPSWSKEPIESGQGDEVEVIYNTALAGSFMKTIIVYSSAVNSPVRLIIKGKVVEGQKEQH